MTIASELTKLNTNLANSYTVISGRGGTLPQAQNMDNLATAISSIPGGGGGYSELPSYQIVNGVASRKSKALTGNEFSNITSAGDYGLYYAFYRCIGLTGLLDLSSLTNVDSMGLSHAFRNCTSLTSVDLSSLTTMSGNYGLDSAFYDCTGLTSINLSSLTTVSGNYGLDSAFRNCTSLTSVDLSSLTTVSGNYGLDSAFQYCSGLTSVDLSSLTTVGSNSLYNTFSNCTGLTSIDLSSLTSIGMDGLRSTFSSCVNLKVLSFPALSPENITDDSFLQMLTGCTNVTVHFPFELESMMSSWSNVINGFSGTNTTVLFDLNGCELTFVITPNTGNVLGVNGDELSSNSTLVVKSSIVSYQIYNSSYGLYISEYSAPDADSATVTVDITTPTYNTISLNTGVSGLTATINVDGIGHPLTEIGTTGVYIINIYKTISDSVSVNYYVSSGSSYADASGTLTFNNSDISETITMQPTQDITFTRPNLTANGTMGGDSFAVYLPDTELTTAYRAVDNSATTYVQVTKVDNYSTFEFYNPSSLKISQLDFVFSTTTSTTNSPEAMIVEGSNDGSSWTQINTWSGTASTSLTFTVNSSNYYKYHRLLMTPKGTGTRVRIYDLGITAVYKG